MNMSLGVRLHVDGERGNEEMKAPDFDGIYKLMGGLAILALVGGVALVMNITTAFTAPRVPEQTTSVVEALNKLLPPGEEVVVGTLIGVERTGSTVNASVRRYQSNKVDTYEVSTGGVKLALPEQGACILLIKNNQIHGVQPLD